LRQSIYRERFKRELLPDRVAIAKRRVAIAERRVAIAERRVAIAERRVAIAERRVAIAELRVAIAKLRVVIAELRVAIAKRRVAIAELRVPAASSRGTPLCKAPGVSPQRGEMFIATSASEKDLAPLGAKCGSSRFVESAKVMRS
jgi:hypothetical protein